jgi:hypothetical protein
MSYLNAVRLVFSGTFQADPSTVNNDVRHYDNARFKKNYQEFSEGQELNGWWNPPGSGAFRLLNCTVKAVHYADGTSSNRQKADPVVGLSILDSPDRTAGKIVDIDPQWQLASQLWGLKVRLTEVSGDTAKNYLTSSYLENPFRDLWFTRMSGASNDHAASATFQSVLTDLEWASTLPDSRFLDELRQATQEGKLSIRLTTYAYKDDHTQPGFTTGTVTGVIGPYLSGEPTSFVAGRRFAPAKAQTGTSWNNITFFTGVLDGATRRLFLDLSNALPIDTDGNPLDLGTLSVGALLAADTPEGAPVGIGNFQPFVNLKPIDNLGPIDNLDPIDSLEAVGKIPYLTPNWLLNTSGIAEFVLTKGQMANQSPPPNQFFPLALAVQTCDCATPLVAIRETTNGLFVGAEPFVLRIDSDVDGPVSVTTKLYATAYGQPAPYAGLIFGQTGAMPGLGGGGGIDQPTAPIPVAGIPEEALDFPSGLTAGTDGTTTLTIQATPPGNPRCYIDGQLYNVTYKQPGQAPNDYGPFELISIHLRNAYPVPAEPTWEANIKPIFVQYGNLYPIMSRRLVNLNCPVSVNEHRKLLMLAFSLDIHDPNYMPVTRDLSEGKRRTIVKWLGRMDQDAQFQALLKAALEAPAGPGPIINAPPERIDAAETEPVGGKTEFARSLAASRARAGKTVPAE